MPRREKSRIERLADIANYLKRARDEAQAIDLRSTPKGGRSSVQELRDDLDALGEKLVKAMRVEAEQSLGLRRDEELARQD